MAQNIVFKVSADTSGIKTGMDKAQQATRNVSKEVSVLDKQFAQLGSLVAGAFAVGSVVQFGKAVAAVSAEVQSLQVRMNSLAGSESAGAKAMEDLSRMAEKLGLNFMDLANSFVQFTSAAKASGMEVKQAERIFKSMSVAIAGSGASAEQAKRAMTALTQMIGKGTISAEELRGQLGEAMPQALGIMAKSMGVTVNELGKMMEKGQLISNEVLPKFAREMENAFGADAQKLAQGLQAEINRLDNAWTDFMSQMGKSSVISGSVSLLTKSVEVLAATWALATFNMSEYMSQKDRQAKLDAADEANRNTIKQIQSEIDAYGDIEVALEELTKKYNNLYNEVEDGNKRIERNNKRRLGVAADKTITDEFVKQLFSKQKTLELLESELSVLREQAKTSTTITTLSDKQLKAIEKERIERIKVAREMAKALKDVYKFDGKIELDPFTQVGLDLRREARNKELTEAEKTAKMLRDIELKGQDREIADFKAKIKEKEELAKSEKQIRQQFAADTFNGLTELATTFYRKDLAKQTEALQKRLEVGEISEQEYAKQVRKIKRKEAIADRIAALSQIAISTAVNIASVQNAASAGLLTGVYLTNAAIQSGIVLAQPVPYNKGTKRVPMMRGAIRGRDSVHAILTPDERVVPADINSQPGYSALLDLAQDKKISDKEAGMIASIATGGRSGNNQVSFDPDELGKSIAKHIPHTNVSINDRGIAVITERSQSEIRRLRTRL